MRHGTRPSGAFDFSWLKADKDFQLPTACPGGGDNKECTAYVMKHVNMEPDDTGLLPVGRKAMSKLGRELKQHLGPDWKHENACSHNERAKQTAGLIQAQLGGPTPTPSHVLAEVHDDNPDVSIYATPLQTAWEWPTSLGPAPATSPSDEEAYLKRVYEATLDTENEVIKNHTREWKWCKLMQQLTPERITFEDSSLEDVERVLGESPDYKKLALLAKKEGQDVDDAISKVYQICERVFLRITQNPKSTELAGMVYLTKLLHGMWSLRHGQPFGADDMMGFKEVDTSGQVDGKTFVMLTTHDPLVTFLRVLLGVHWDINCSVVNGKPCFHDNVFYASSIMIGMKGDTNRKKMLNLGWDLGHITTDLWLFFSRYRQDRYDVHPGHRATRCDDRRRLHLAFQGAEPSVRQNVGRYVG